MKLYRYFFHYNKPASKAAGKPQLTIHFKNKCYIVDKITNYTTCESKNNPRQPFCVIQGMAYNVFIRKNHAIIA